MRTLAQLLRLLLVDGLLATAALVVVATFGVHLLFSWLPAPVERSYVVRLGEDAVAAERSGAAKLERQMRLEGQARWLRGGGDGRLDVARRLLAEQFNQDLAERAERRAAGPSRRGRLRLGDYGRWLAGVARLDLGVTRAGLQVIEELQQKALLTLRLSVTAYLLALLAGAWIALVRIAREDRWWVRGAHYLGYLLTTMPAFLLGYLVISAFRLDLSEQPGLAPAVLTLTFSSGILNEVDRTAHQSLLEEMASGYVQTARVKGLAQLAALPFPGTVAFHAFRQAAVRFLPRLATRVPLVVGMSLLVEKVFVLEGLGDMLIDGLAFREEPRVLAVMLVAVLIVQLCALATRGGHLLLDPRARLREGGDR